MNIPSTESGASPFLADMMSCPGKSENKYKIVTSNALRSVFCYRQIPCPHHLARPPQLRPKMHW